MIALRGIAVRYAVSGGSFAAVDGVDLQLGADDICALIGPSGCGKSSLLHVLAGILKEFTGEALIDGRRVDPKKQKIGFIPQNYGLLEWADVYANSVLGLDIKHERRRRHTEYIDYILNELGLSDLRRKYPGQLSGGQRQRVSIARAFILKPEILLMDEPFSALDALIREDIQDLFLGIWNSNKVPTIFVTHSIEEAVYVGSKIAVMSPSPGKIVKIIDNELFGASRLRTNDQFYKTAIELRKIAEKEWGR